ncbi:MAG: hypothetical protein OEV74_20895 [Cyclobacteriaceae bacterium]|nr:hypothetical protein [Cyclobacteriaceae bacterium]
MKRLLLILIVISPAFQVHGQTLDSLNMDLTIINSLPVNSLTALDSIQQDANHSFTNLKNDYDSLEQAYNGITSSLQLRIDSLNAISIPSAKFIQKLDSINQIKETKLAGIRSKLDGIKSITIGKIENLSLPPELKAKAQDFTDAVTNLDLNVPAANLHLPSLNLPGAPNIAIPTLKIPASSTLVKLPSAQVPGLSGIAPTTAKLQGLNQALPQGAGSIDQIGKIAESQVTKISEVGAIQDQLGQFPDTQFSTEDQAKQVLLSQAKEAVVDHFAGRGEELQAAMDQMSKYKKKYASINSLSEIKRRPPNEMKGKPLIERIVPGIAFQLQKKNDALLVDFSPYTGYRFTGKITGGLGWNHRVSYNLKNSGFNKEARIYGPRVFGEYKLLPGLSPRIEVETMNTYVPPFARSSSSVDEHGREWVWGTFVGIKKDYKFLKKINGTAMVMFRLFDPHRKSPYADIINARFGFEFPMKKKVKAS